MIYTVDEIKNLVTPIARKYKLKSLWIFGSYARGEATAESDVDFLMDYDGSTISNLYDFSDIFDSLEIAINKKIDLITIEGLFDNINTKRAPKFTNRVCKERIKIYERSG
ncbi:MAG: nucleotidyltransferase domain-containing protein [Deltaproteobacteria bacterium]|jgi:predicted nucleotidyltransferase|nr:nucleotidyltransferase domain-containing protein [Deltaproteobacteria bacterium]